MLTKMKLGNFKSWPELDIDLAPITLLFGTNSSGKTSILHALLLLKQTANSFDRGQHINFGGNDRDYINFGSYRDVVFEHDEHKNISVFLEWTRRQRPAITPTNVQLHLTFFAVWQQMEDRVAVEQLEYNAVINDETKVSLKAKRHDDRYSVELVPEVREEEERSYPLRSFYDLPHIGFPVRLREIDYQPFRFSRDFESLLGSITYLGPLRQHPERHYQWTGSTPQIIEPSGKNTIEALIASARGRSKRRDLLLQVEEWLTKLGLVSQFEVEAIDRDRRFYETRVKVGREHVYSSILDVGFGVSQVLPVLTILFFVPEGSIVLIEQPELHLHPSAQAHLADLFLHVAETRNLQLIIESHSEHLLRRLQRRIAEPEYPFATPENIKAYFCKAGANGSNIQPVEVDEYGQIRNWPDNFFGDLGGDLDAMMDAALERRRQELSESG